MLNFSRCDIFPLSGLFFRSSLFFDGTAYSDESIRTRFETWANIVSSLTPGEGETKQKNDNLGITNTESRMKLK